MLVPKKVKFRKQHKLSGNMHQAATRKLTVSYGSVGLKALEGGWITSRQIEAARRSVARFLKRGGKMWIRIFPDKSVTAHGNESTMGGGKGAVDYYVAVVRPGTVMFELDGIGVQQAREAFTLAGYKLPVKTKVVLRT